MLLLRRTCVILAAFALIGLTTACGQKGPLFLPGEPQPVNPKSDQDTIDPSDMPTKSR